MTAPNQTDSTTPVPAPEPEKLGLSATQLVASGLAAMSSTVVASFFGVAGTVIGAALGSVVAVAGNAVYGYSLRRTRSRVRRTLDVAVAHRFATEPSRVIAQHDRANEQAAARQPAATEPPARDRRLASYLQRNSYLRPKRLALAAAGLFAAVIAVTTGFELASGQPLSSTVTGKHGSGVSIGGGTAKQASPSPLRSVTPSTTGSPSQTGSVSPTVTVTVTPSDSATPSGSPTAPSSEPTSSPAPSASPSGS